MVERLYSTDTFARNLWQTMAEDFRLTLNDPSFCVEQGRLLTPTTMQEFRQFKYPRRMLRPYYFFKAEYQMENLFKRYIFETDAYTHDELLVQTSNKFKETQTQINVFSYPTRTLRVLSWARGFIKETLGKYDASELLDLCRHGSRASIGIPLRDAYLDNRFVKELSGSRDQINWFKRTYLPQDPVLVALYKAVKKEPLYSVCYNLRQTCVPKSWKSLRSIAPNTTIGAFRTYGLGLMIRKRIENIGLNLSTLPERHKRLAALYSKTRKGVTADLSSASDSFSPWLVNRLIPRDWYRALKLGRINHITVGEEDVYLNSFMTMGIGFTFPLQTLLFYSILKGIQALSGFNGHISVFGDDLIYPTEMHNMVAQVFTDLSFKLNQEKTFVKEEFRESCGGDYYCGIDVRPFSPEGQSRQLGPKPYLSFLYRVYNGLFRRWTIHDLPLSNSLLLAEIGRIRNSPHRVPSDFPDHSGLKTDEIALFCENKTDKHGNTKRTFPYLKLHYPIRRVEYQEFYYWEKLRTMTVEMLNGLEDDPYYPSTRDILQWVKSKPERDQKTSSSCNGEPIAHVIKRGHPRVRFVEATGRFVY